MSSVALSTNWHCDLVSIVSLCPVWPYVQFGLKSSAALCHFLSNVTNCWHHLMTLQIESSDHSDDLTFSFIGALEEGYFSDLIIKASSGKQVRCLNLKPDVNAE